MSRPLIAVDLDDTLRPWTHPLREWVAEQLGLHHLPYQTAPQVMLAEVFGCTRSDGNTFANRFAIEPAGRDHPPFDDALPILTELKKSYDLIVVTARLRSLEAITREYLELHFPGIFTDVILASYQIDRTPKHVICKEIGARNIIDDRLTYVEEYAAAGMYPILFGDYPLNQAERLSGRVVRAASWRDVPEAIGKQMVIIGSNAQRVIL